MAVAVGLPVPRCDPVLVTTAPTAGPNPYLDVRFSGGRCSGGPNWYAYVNNDPVNWRDPWGLEVLSVVNSGNMNTPGSAWYNAFLGETDLRIRDVGCAATAFVRVLNAVDGTSYSPLFWSLGGESSNSGAGYITPSGDLLLAEALSGETGNDNPVVRVQNAATNPDAVRERLATLEQLREGYYVMGKATIRYTDAIGNQVETPHWVNITNATVSRDGTVSIEWMPTSENDLSLNRTYTIGPPNPGQGVFRIEEIAYVQRCAD